MGRRPARSQLHSLFALHALFACAPGCEVVGSDSCPEALWVLWERVSVADGSCFLKNGGQLRCVRGHVLSCERVPAL